MIAKGMKRNVAAVSVLPVLLIWMILLCGCAKKEVPQTQTAEREPVQQKVKAVGAYVTIEEEEVPLAAVPVSTEDVMLIEESGEEAAKTPAEDAVTPEASETDAVETKTEKTDAATAELPEPVREVEVLLNEEASPTEVVVESENQVSFAEGILAAVNEERAASGLPGLTVTPELSAAAAQRAGEISESFSHTRPAGMDYHTAVSEAGGSFGSVGENLFRGTESVEAVRNAWSGSPVHQENILNGSFAHIGIGVAETPGGVYVVQIFTD